MTMMISCLIIIILTIVVLLHQAAGRPSFRTSPAAFDGSPQADSDGIFRHDSTTIDFSSKREEPDDGIFLRYEASLIPGIIRLDSILAVEEVACDAVATLSVKVASSSDPPADGRAGDHPSNWKSGQTVVGGPEWRCMIDKQGRPESFVAKIKEKVSASSSFAAAAAVWYMFEVEWMEMEKLFQHLDMDMRYEPSTISPSEDTPHGGVHQVGPVQSGQPEGYRTPVGPAQDKPQKAAALAKRQSDPIILKPVQGDIFLTGDTLVVEWANMVDSPIAVDICYRRNNYPDRCVRIADPFPNPSAGSVSYTIPGSGLEAGVWYISIKYDCTVFCSTLESKADFLINASPAVNWIIGLGGNIYQFGDILKVYFEVQDPTITFPLYVSIWHQNDYWFDTQVGSEVQYTWPNPYHEHNIDSSWELSNKYYVYMEYSCWGVSSLRYCASSQTSELFTVTDQRSPYNAAVVEPMRGSGYQTWQQIPLTITGSFSVDTQMYLTLYRRRVGWDAVEAEATITYGANQPAAYHSWQVLPEFDPSSQYYILIEWGCDTWGCRSSLQSSDFAVNYNRLLSFNLLPKQSFTPNDQILLSWYFSGQNYPVDVYLCNEIPGPDSCTYLAGGQYNNYLVTQDKLSSAASGLWNNYFYVLYDCTYGYLCTSAISSSFRVVVEYDVFAWNYDSQSHQISDPALLLFRAGCDNVTSSPACQAPKKNALCQLCGVNGFDAEAKLVCEDCYARVTVSVSQFFLKIEWFTVTAFNAAITANATADINLHGSLTITYETELDLTIVPPIAIWGLNPPLRIAGFQLTLGLYGQADLAIKVNLEAQVDVRFSTFINSVYIGQFDLINPQFNISRPSQTFEVSPLEVTAQGHLAVRATVIPELSLKILSYDRAAYVNAAPWVQLDLGAQYPPFPALLPGAVPEPGALLKFPTACGFNHWIEFNVTCGLDFNVGTEMTNPAKNYPFAVSLPAPASGCLWQAPGGSSTLVLVNLPFSATYVNTLLVDLLEETFLQLIKYDVADALAIEVSWIARVEVDTSGSVPPGYVVVRLGFLDVASQTAADLADVLSASVQNTSSSLYASERQVTKNIVALPVPTTGSAVSAGPTGGTTAGATGGTTAGATGGTTAGATEGTSAGATTAGTTGGTTAGATAAGTTGSTTGGPTGGATGETTAGATGSATDDATTTTVGLVVDAATGIHPSAVLLIVTIMITTMMYMLL